MKVLAFSLALSFALIQPVSLTECPCGALCENKNSCTLDKNVPDCCTRSAADAPPQRHTQEKDTCFHVEPQTDLDGPGVEQAAVPPVDVEFIAVTSALPNSEMSVVPQPSGLSPPARGRPLYLQHSSFLI